MSIETLQEWYASNCNGQWEHSFGIEITTLDNPGWMVTLDLSGTVHEMLTCDYKSDLSPSDWMFCKIEDKKFIGTGDVRSLSRILNYFDGLIVHR